MRIQPRNPYQRPSKKRKQAAAEYNAGIGVSALSRKYGVTRQRVYQWLASENVVLRWPKPPEGTP